MSTSDKIAAIGLVVSMLMALLVYQQNRLIKRKNEILAERNPSMSKASRLKNYWPLLTMATLASLTLAAVGYDYHDRRSGASASSRISRQFVRGWGGAPREKTCRATVDASQLMNWSDKYNVAIMCGLVDSGVDRYEDERITISQPFSIHPGDLEMSADYSPAMIDVGEKLLNEARKKLPDGVPRQYAQVAIKIWTAVVVLPKSSKVSDIRRLSDVAKYGGTILGPTIPNR